MVAHIMISKYKTYNKCLAGNVDSYFLLHLQQACTLERAIIFYDKRKNEPFAGVQNDRG